MGAFKESLRLNKQIIDNLSTPAIRMRALQQFVNECIKKDDFTGALKMIKQEMGRPKI